MAYAMNTRAVIVTALVLLSAKPGLAQWTQGGRGKFWVKSALFWQQTDQEFDLLGTRRQRIDAGKSNSRVLYTDVIAGVLPTVDLWVQIPFYDLGFTTAAVDTQSVGFGDIRAWLRWQVASLHRGATPIAIRVGAKAPIGSSPLDAEVIPLGEGQWDLEFFGEIGHSFWPLPAYAELWLGYRARLRNSTKRKDPGGEYVFLTEAGVNPTSTTLIKVTLDGFVGRKWTVEGIRTNTSRRIVTLQLGGGVRVVGGLWSEGGVRLPLSGQDFPAGPQFVLGMSGGFSLGR